MYEIFDKEFNEMIIDTFHLILKEEMEFIKSLAGYELSSREIHFLQVVGTDDGRHTISDIAAALHITLASITIIANRLESEGYIIKRKNTSDGREILLSLTEKGKEIDKRHNEWHIYLVKRITGGMSPFEKEILLTGVKKLNSIFKSDLAEQNNKTAEK